MELEKNLKKLEERSNEVISSPSPTTIIEFQKQVKKCQNLLDKNTNKDAEKYFQGIIQKEALKEIFTRLEQQELFNELEKAARKSENEKKDGANIDFDKISENVLRNIKSIVERVDEKLRNAAKGIHVALPSSIDKEKFTSDFLQTFRQEAIRQEACAEFVVQSRAAAPSLTVKEGVSAFLNNKQLIENIDKYANLNKLNPPEKTQKVIPVKEMLRKLKPELREQVRDVMKRYGLDLDIEDRQNAEKPYLPETADPMPKATPDPAPAPAPAPDPAPIPTPAHEQAPITKSEPSRDPLTPSIPVPSEPTSVVTQNATNMQHQIETATASGEQEKQTRLIDKVEQNTGGKDFYTNERVLTTKKEIREREADERHNPQATNIPLPPRQETTVVTPTPLLDAQGIQPATTRLREKSAAANENKASNSMCLRPPQQK